jgi:hypothetical protein
MSSSAAWIPYLKTPLAPSSPGTATWSLLILYRAKQRGQRPALDEDRRKSQPPRGEGALHLIRRSVGDVGRGEIEDVASEHILLHLVLVHRGGVVLLMLWHLLVVRLEVVVLGLLVLVGSAGKRAGESEGRKGDKGESSEFHGDRGVEVGGGGWFVVEVIGWADGSVEGDLGWGTRGSRSSFKGKKGQRLGYSRYT